MEIIGADMLEETADDRAHADVLAQAAHARHEAAYPADDEVDLDAGQRRFVEGVDHGLIHERVHLCHDARRTAGGGVGGFTANELDDPAMQGEGCDEEVGEVWRAAEAGEGVEQRGRVGGKGFA
jgi:hypothetical protein